MESPTLLIVLRGLHRTDGKDVMRTAVKELIARQVLRVEPGRPPSRWHKRTFELLRGPAPYPVERVLLLVVRWVEESPSHVTGTGLVGHDLAATAKHLAAQPQARKVVVDAALEDLIAAGLVVREQRRVLGMFTRTVPVRTSLGEQVLAAAWRRRQGDGGGDGGSVHPYPYGDSDGDRQRDPFDAGIDSRMDQSFDSSFDSSFNSSFDSSFDSGFSSGDGGGGDGGGGGGGGD